MSIVLTFKWYNLPEIKDFNWELLNQTCSLNGRGAISGSISFTAFPFSSIFATVTTLLTSRPKGPQAGRTKIRKMETHLLCYYKGFGIKAHTHREKQKLTNTFEWWVWLSSEEIVAIIAATKVSIWSQSNIAINNHAHWDNICKFTFVGQLLV